MDMEFCVTWHPAVYRCVPCGFPAELEGYRSLETSGQKKASSFSLLYLQTGESGFYFDGPLQKYHDRVFRDPIRLTVGLDDLEFFFQMNDAVILFFKALNLPEE